LDDVLKHGVQRSLLITQVFCTRGSRITRDLIPGGGGSGKTISTEYTNFCDSNYQSASHKILYLLWTLVTSNCFWHHECNINKGGLFVQYPREQVGRLVFWRYMVLRNLTVLPVVLRGFPVSSDESQDSTTHSLLPNSYPLTTHDHLHASLDAI